MCKNVQVFNTGEWPNRNMAAALHLVFIPDLLTQRRRGRGSLVCIQKASMSNRLRSVLAIYLSRRVHNEIHTIMKPSEALPSQVFQVVGKLIKGQKAGKGAHFVFRPHHKGHIGIKPKRHSAHW